MQTDPLVWWRTRRPKDLSPRLADRLYYRLVEATPRNTGKDQLLARVQDEEPDAPFKLGLMLMGGFNDPGPRRDLAMSWLYLCAVGPAPFNEHHQDARLLLAGTLFEDVRIVYGSRTKPSYVTPEELPNWPDPGARFRAGRAMVIAEKLFARTRPLDTLFRDYLHQARQDAQRDLREARQSREETTAAPTPDTGTTRRVALASEIPKVGGYEDRKFIEAYQPLLQPYPLAGGGIDGERIADVLAAACPWADAFAERVRRELRLRRSCGLPWFKLRPVLLVGPPGTGKTRLARRLAQLVGVGSQELSVGGASDNRHLQGTARGWSSAQPAAPVSAIQRHGIANPMMILDEVDKAGGSDRNGRLHDTLLGFLEPETAGNWFDEALQVPCDLSHVSWVLTANDASRLPDALRSRVAVIEIPKPDAGHLDELLHGLATDLAAELGVRVDDLPALDDEAVAELRRDLQRHGDVRRIRRGYEEAIAVAAGPVARSPH